MANLTITKQQARRFLTYYHGLSEKNSDLEGKAGIMAFIERVGSIQFDPLNVVGMNHELVLQARIPQFDRAMLRQLLYEDRLLFDQWDKCMSIVPVTDWPYFARFRRQHEAWCSSNQDTVNQVYSEIETRGPLCSSDLDYAEKVDWGWGPTRLSRAALEGMYYAGSLVVHHKVGTRRFYDLAKRCIPETLYAESDPIEADEQYFAWNVLRRVGSIGLLWNRPSDAWIGIRGMKSRNRNDAFKQLLASGQLIEVHVEGVAYPLYIRARDLGLFERSMEVSDDSMKRTSLLAPLDNFMWDRALIKELFDFEYRWEVYKPAAEREYGYYVLPVVYGDQLVARVEFANQRKKSPLTILNWWWERDLTVDAAMRDTVVECLERFAAYLGTTFDRSSFA
ncbi:winged helix-turn-helix domain-containing protein [Paenibacillus albus]|uniref:Winged helix-turn-helix domain-containing protein n=1 Tax=Paenibacillus albus TaxID=2495582 RepID=A0A3Q8X686_9BACL|nr:crosslink repair DNA glycosylase YcaQ family protein [Paenibacillus albus]AZN41018.1 winged helix-turn-helix domain-containing protein [Paenibacillus albus]